MNKEEAMEAWAAAASQLWHELRRCQRELKDRTSRPKDRPEAVNMVRMAVVCVHDKGCTAPMSRVIGPMSWEEATTAADKLESEGAVEEAFAMDLVATWETAPRPDAPGVCPGCSGPLLGDGVDSPIRCVNPECHEQF